MVICANENSLAKIGLNVEVEWKRTKHRTTMTWYPGFATPAAPSRSGFWSSKMAQRIQRSRPRFWTRQRLKKNKVKTKTTQGKRFSFWHPCLHRVCLPFASLQVTVCRISDYTVCLWGRGKTTQIQTTTARHPVDHSNSTRGRWASQIALKFCIQYILWGHIAHQNSRLHSRALQP